MIIWDKNAVISKTKRYLFIYSRLFSRTFIYKWIKDYFVQINRIKSSVIKKDRVVSTEQFYLDIKAEHADILK